MHDLGSKPVHRSWTLSVLSPIEKQTNTNSWDHMPGTCFGAEMIQEVLTGPRKVSKWVLLI